MVVGVVMLVMGGLYIRGLHNYVIELVTSGWRIRLPRFRIRSARSTRTNPHAPARGAGARCSWDSRGSRRNTDRGPARRQVAGSAVFGDDGPEPPTPPPSQTSSAARGPIKPFTADLAGLGRYRLQSHQIDSDDQLISGISLERANAALARKTPRRLCWWYWLFCCPGSVRIAIRYALAPLRRVAATAASVVIATRRPGARITAGFRRPTRHRYPTSGSSVIR